MGLSIKHQKSLVFFKLETKILAYKSRLITQFYANLTPLNISLTKSNYLILHSPLSITN
jgi:hypothetical protein